MNEVKPGVVVAVIIVVLIVAGGAWFLSNGGPSGVPAAGQSGRSDPMLSGPNNIMKAKGAVNPVKGGRLPDSTNR